MMSSSGTSQSCGPSSFPSRRHAYPLTRDIAQGSVDGVDDAVAKAEEICKWPVLIGVVALAREIRAVELQQETIGDDGFVLDPQSITERVEEGFLTRIVLVEHDRRYHAG